MTDNKTVKRELLTNIRMTTGGEKKHPTVILDGNRREWVGFAWVDCGVATTSDFERYPTVID